MKKFLVIYEAPVSAAEQMANATPEQAKAGMDAWMTRAKKAGNSIVDLGAPLGDPATFGRASAVNGGTKAVGYSVLQGESSEALTELLREHPHGRVPNFSIQFFECLPLPTEVKQPHAA
jgi:hypothetical protein